RSREARSKSMVLSPIEPVAPSTVTLRSPEAAALLLRNGTALMNSPNHKTAADAIHAVPQSPENSRHNNRRHQTVEPVHQPTVTGNGVAGILDAKAAFDCGFEEVAKLPNYGQSARQSQQ